MARRKEHRKNRKKLREPNFVALPPESREDWELAIGAD
jgi:hypothetical protein